MEYYHLTGFESQGGTGKTSFIAGYYPLTGVESNSEPVYYDLDTGYRYYPLRG